MKGGGNKRNNSMIRPIDAQVGHISFGKLVQPLKITPIPVKPLKNACISFSIVGPCKPRANIFNFNKTKGIKKRLERERSWGMEIIFPPFIYRRKDLVKVPTK